MARCHNMGTGSFSIRFIRNHLRATGVSSSEQKRRTSMKPIIPVLAAAALGIVSLTASAARADEGRWGRHEAPVASRAYDPRAEHGSWRDREHGDERDRRVREVETTRERFYASWDGNQRARARFEAWYAARCAELGG
jgi:hypothetical protein